MIKTSFKLFENEDNHPDIAKDDPIIIDSCQMTKETQTESGDFLEKDQGRLSGKHVAHLSCSVNGRHVIIVDDMIDTGHTINIALKVSFSPF